MIDPMNYYYQSHSEEQPLRFSCCHQEGFVSIKYGNDCTQKQTITVICNFAHRRRAVAVLSCRHWRFSAFCGQ